MKKRKMTLFLDQGETLGGAEKFLLDMLQTIDPQERNMIHPVIVGAKNKAYKSLIPEKVTVINFDCPSVKGLKIISFFKILLASWRLRKIFKVQSQKFTIQMFANTPRMMLLAWALKFFWRQNFRLLIMVHDFTIPKFIFTRIAQKSEVIIVNSVLTRQVVRSSLSKREHQKIMIVENGIDFKTLVAKPADIVSTEIKKVVLLGRIDPRKGQMFALEAAKELQKQGSNIEFSIIGSPFEEDLNTQKYEQLLHKKAEEWQLKNVRFLPAVEHPWDVFSSADLILVLPTQPETFGRVVIEGLALNKPLIVFDEMGPREIMNHFARFARKNLDYFVCPKNSAVLAKKILEISANRDLVDPFLKKGELFVKKYYDQADTKKQLVNILLDS